MDIYGWWYRNHAFWMYQRLERRPTAEFLACAREMERWVPDRIRAWQWRRLTRLLEHAKSTVPYYADAYASVDLASLSRWEDFARLPLLEKSSVRLQRERFISSRTPYALGTVRTSGSTGQPLIFYSSPRTQAAGLTAMMRAKAWWGVDFCERSAMFIEHGHKFEKDWRQQVKMFLRPLRERLVNRIFFSAYDMAERDLDRYYRRLVRFQPAYLGGYATSLFLLAQHMERHGLDGKRIGASHVFYTSEMLYPWQKELMERTFGAKIVGEYGMVELGVLAHQCPAGSFHTMDDLAYVELVPLKEDPSLAEVVVTSLFNTDTPLIRYRTGDVVHHAGAAQAPCACGLGLHTMGRLEGRSHDLIVAPSGRVLHGQIFTHIINHTGQVRRFQVEQESAERILLRIVRESGYSSAHESEIREKLLGMLGPEAAITFEYVENIAPEASGKYRWIRSRVGALRRQA